MLEIGPPISDGHPLPKYQMQWIIFNATYVFFVLDLQKWIMHQAFESIILVHLFVTKLPLSHDQTYWLYFYLGQKRYCRVVRAGEL